MLNHKYNAILDFCASLSEKVKNPQIEATTDWLRTSLLNDHKPTMALVAFSLNHADRIAIAESYIGTKVPADIAETLEGQPCCVILDYNDTPAILNQGDGASNYLVLGLPSEHLKNIRIAICDEISAKEEWFDLSNEIDAACLLVNATMAMSQAEREWLKNCAKPLFGEGEIILNIGKLNLLNTAEDIDAVRKTVADSLMRLDITAKIFENEMDAMKYMAEQLDQQETVAERHDKRVAQNGLNLLKQQMKALSDEVAISEDTIQSTIKQLEKQRLNLELAGRFAADSVFANEMASLKIQALESIRDYGKQMAESIRAQIEKAPQDKLETLDERVNGYIIGMWDYYLDNQSKKMDTEMERIAQSLTRQMEQDAGTLIANLDESARRVIYEAIGLHGDIEQMPLIPDAHSRNLLGEVSVEDVTDKLRKETRNMMLLSLPLLFVHPLAAAGNLFLSKYIGKWRTDKELKAMRAEIAEQTDVVCFENADKIAEQVETGFEDATREGALHIKDAYRQIIDQIIKNLDELKVAQTQKTQLNAYIREQSNTIVPQLLDSLE